MEKKKTTGKTETVEKISAKKSEFGFPAPVAREI